MDNKMNSDAESCSFNELLVTIAKLNKQIENEWRYVDQVINAKSIVGKSCLFDEYAVFDSAPKTSGNESGKILGRHGIYIFLFKKDIRLTKEQVLEFNSLSGAKIKNEYIRNDGIEFLSRECLYTGSCINKSLYTRLEEHFGNKKCSSLHLAAKERQCLQGMVTAYAFPIKKEFDDHLRIITPGLEHQMHIQFCPMAGSSRV